LIGLIWLFGGLDGFETRTWDWRARLLAKPTEATEDIALIFLDQNSLDWAQEANGLSWPWPREVYSYIISFCKRAGVKGLIFDVLFTEPSKYGVYDDQALADAISDIGATSLVPFF
jgi:adenylate cyclase